MLGSYGLSGDMVFINLKVVQPGSSLVLAAYDYALPLNREVRSLLACQADPGLGPDSAPHPR